MPFLDDALKLCNGACSSIFGAQDSWGLKTAHHTSTLSMKYFSNFSIRYRRGTLSITRGFGLKVTYDVSKSGLSNLKPTKTQT